MHSLRPHGPDRDQGAVAILVALSMTVVLVATAMVLDFGIARVDRATNKGTTDAAVLAGLRGLVGVDYDRKPWRGVCAALTYLGANGEQLAR